MMKKNNFNRWLIFVLLIGVSRFAAAQMVVGTDTLYGNEWINYSQKYYKISSTAQGVIKVGYAQLQTVVGAANLSGLRGKQLRMYNMGKEIPIFVSDTGLVATGFYIEFYAKPQPNYIDQFMLRDTSKWFSPNYSWITDASPYFLTWNSAPNPLRYNTASNGVAAGGLAPKETFFMATAGQPFYPMLDFDNWTAGLDYAGGANRSDVNYKGWGLNGGYEYKGYLESNATLTPKMLYAAGDSSVIKLRLKLRENVSHNTQISWNGNTLRTFASNGILLKNFRFKVANSTVNATNTLKIKGLLGGLDKHAVASVTIDYPHTFDFENKSSFDFTVAASNQSRYFEITNFATGNAGSASIPPVLYDLTYNLRIQTVLENGVVKFVLPPSNQGRVLNLRANGATPGYVSSSPIFAAVNFVNYTAAANQGDYIIITNTALRNDGQGNDWVQEYANYRKISGFQKPIIVDANDLYNQFAYGVDQHPLSMRNFGWFAKRKFIVNPKYVFLLGKGYWMNAVRSGSTSLVPTFGLPSSDNLMMAGINTNTPVIPVGRLSASNGTDVKVYLKKVKEYEANIAAAPTQANKDWMKNVMHFIGAQDVPSIPGYMTDLKNTIQQPNIGARVYTFQKTSTDPVQQAASSRIDSLVNAGSSIMTFFGHAALQLVDFNVAPETMQNRGKYPLVLSLGCNSGDMFSAFAGNLGEKFVFTPDRGGIGFIGSASYSIPDDLHRFTKNFYRHANTDLYGRGFGDIMQSSIADGDQTNVLSNHLLNLLADPALKLNAFPSPDLIVKDNSIRFNPATVVTTADSFNVDFTLMNIGKSVKDTVEVTISRTYPLSSITETKKLRLSVPVIEDVFSTKLPVGEDRALGDNTIKICVDSRSEVAELPNPDAENNNCTTVTLPIYSNQVIPVYPPNFGIVPKDSVRLKVATTFPFGAKTNYIIQMDTTETYDSPFVQRYVVTGFQGGLLEKKVALVPYNASRPDSIVYYWRVKLSNGLPKDTLWQNSSFVHLNGASPGWNQSHYYQYLKDRFTTMALPKGSRKFKFVDTQIEFTATVKNGTDQNIFINGTAGYNDSRQLGSSDAGITLIAVNPLDGETLLNPYPGIYGSLNGNNRASVGFFFPTQTKAQRDTIRYFINNIVPNGYYIFVFNRNDYKPSLWAADRTPTRPSDLFDSFESLGLTRFRQSATAIGCYAGLGRKGFPIQTVTIKEKLTSSLTDEIIREQFLIPGQWFSGKVQSTVIGPASNWKEAHWRTFATDGQPAGDSISLDLYGIKSNNQEVLLMPKGTIRDFSIANIDANLYPYIRLQWNTSDPTRRTSQHLDYWRILYDPIPEAVLRPEKFFAVERDFSVDRGENLRVRVAVESINETNMDSLRVKYSVVNPSNLQSDKYVKFQPLLGLQTLIADYTINTKDMDDARPYKLKLDVNPVDALRQRELYHFNNTGSIDFNVIQDLKNPLLDVTFDGQHILYNDVVSSKPHIVISLKDENKYLALNDTAKMALFLRYSTTSSPLITDVTTRIPFSDSRVRFIPPTSAQVNNNNRARIEWNATFEKDGYYTLFVQAEDIAKNASGSSDYRVGFRIINKAGISQMLNYPNPFTTSTRFVFTVTGSEVPDYLKIQIMTVTGQIVREITQEELGSIHVGLNKTDFAWDGTDQFGDKLANGVYLYRVTARKANGQPYEIINDAENGGKLDTYFKGGFGKMYLMR